MVMADRLPVQNHFNRTRLDVLVCLGFFIFFSLPNVEFHVSESTSHILPFKKCDLKEKIPLSCFHASVIKGPCLTQSPCCLSAVSGKRQGFLGHYSSGLFQTEESHSKIAFLFPQTVERPLSHQLSLVRLCSDESFPRRSHRHWVLRSTWR